MSALRKTIGLALMCCLTLTASCANKLNPSMPPSAASVQCMTDCVAVTKTYVKEHAELFAEVIRLRAAVKFCHEK